MPKIADSRKDATVEVYNAAKAEFDNQLERMRVDVEAVRIESVAAGVLQTLQATSAYNELLRALTLYRIKTTKEYKQGGMTWEGFCESQGLERRTVDMMLADLSPVFTEFSESIFRFSGMPFNKIRLLGRQVSGNISEIQNGCLVYGDESIPLTPEYRDDIQALIERIGEEAREKVEESEAQLSAKDKVLKSKQDLLNKQERELKKYEKEAAAKGLTPDEDAFLQLMSNKKTAFDGYMMTTDPDFIMERAGEITPRMRAALISTLHCMKMEILAAYDTAVMNYGSPGLNPEVLEEYEAWEKAQQG